MRACVLLRSMRADASVTLISLFQISLAVNELRRTSLTGSRQWRNKKPIISWEEESFSPTGINLEVNNIVQQYPIQLVSMAVSSVRMQRRAYYSGCIWGEEAVLSLHWKRAILGVHAPGTPHSIPLHKVRSVSAIWLLACNAPYTNCIYIYQLSIWCKGYTHAAILLKASTALNLYRHHLKS